VAFKCLTSALDLPINDGQFRALDIVLPPGHGQRAQARHADVDDIMTIIDTIFKALAPAIPSTSLRVITPIVVGRVNGRRPRTTASTSISAA
jgi:N-methylhydantoinase B